MKTRKQQLLVQFNQKQQALFHIASQLGLDSKEAIVCSQELDNIVLKLQKLDNLKPMIEFLTYFHGNQDYFHCHTILKEHWRIIFPMEKNSVYVGFFQLAIGMHHYRANNIIGAIEMLSNASNILKNEVEDVAFLGIDAEKLNILMNEVLRNLMRKRPYSSIEIPISNKMLKLNALKNCKELGFQWFNTSYIPDIKLIFKHKLRDRSNFIQKRTQQMKFRANSQKVKLSGFTGFSLYQL